MERLRVDGPWLPLGFGMAAVSLGYALQVANGAYAPEAIRSLTLACLAALIAVVVPSGWCTSRWIETAIAFVLATGVVFQVALMLGAPPGIYMRSPFWSEIKVRVLLLLACLLVGAVLGGGRRATTIVPILLALIHLRLALWMLAASPDPGIDVFVWHREAFRTLAAFHDPYASTMPNIYGSAHWYGPGLVAGGRVLVGFPYPPVSLLIGWLGNLAGDYRLANVAATTLAGMLMAYSSPSPIAKVSAAVFWFSPRLLFALEQGWTDPQVIAFFVATVLCMRKAPKLVPWIFGLLLAVKQYAILVVPLVFLPMPKTPWRAKAIVLAKAGGVALLSVLPFALWHPRQFFDSIGAFQYRQPFRPDALSYLAAWGQSASRFEKASSFFALLPAYVILALRAPRTPAGFAAGSGLVFLAFFAFAKQAFCNYYIMIVGILCCAVANAVVRRPAE